MSAVPSSSSFFFSSRRRHTRWPRDWSSDVCSSDLVPLNDIASEQGKIGGAAQRRFAGGVLLHHVTMSYDIDAVKMEIGRASCREREQVSGVGVGVDENGRERGMGRERERRE